MINLIRQKTAVLTMHKTTNYALIALIFAAAIFYAYSAGMTVRTLATLEKAEGQMQSLSVEVSEMESKRLAIENSVNTEKALSLGFIEVKRPIFIMKDSKKATLSLKTD